MEPSRITGGLIIHYPTSDKKIKLRGKDMIKFSILQNDNGTYNIIGEFKDNGN